MSTERPDTSEALAYESRIARLADVLAEMENRGGCDWTFDDQARYVNEHLAAAPETSPDEEAYRYLADKVIDLFNPRDDDIAEEALLADHLQWVHDYIASLPCVCLPGAAGPDFNEPPCDRCVALGFAANVRIDRG